MQANRQPNAVLTGFAANGSSATTSRFIRTEVQTAPSLLQPQTPSHPSPSWGLTRHTELEIRDDDAVMRLLTTSSDVYELYFAYQKLKTIDIAKVCWCVSLFNPWLHLETR